MRHLTEDRAPHRVVGTVKNCRSEECDREEDKDRDGSGSHDTEQHRGAADHHGEGEEGKEERRDHSREIGEAAGERIKKRLPDRHILQIDEERREPHCHHARNVERRGGDDGPIRNMLKRGAPDHAVIFRDLPLRDFIRAEELPDRGCRDENDRVKNAGPDETQARIRFGEGFGERPHARNFPRERIAARTSNHDGAERPEEPREHNAYDRDQAEKPHDASVGDDNSSEGQGLQPDSLQTVAEPARAESDLFK